MTDKLSSDPTDVPLIKLKLDPGNVEEDVRLLHRKNEILARIVAGEAC